ncbi:hypothetical protein [Nitrosospira sp. Nsp2]|uniref:hypothetical protein n=1 Tax=Nitrosospira sp. Nsp2 TaxID=136548 RepID=UPI000D2F7EE3|nr:hypothetical protein [Nitrosospira sp. Nsp2]
MNLKNAQNRPLKRVPITALKAGTRLIVRANVHVCAHPLRGQRDEENAGTMPAVEETHYVPSMS